MSYRKNIEATIKHKSSPKIGSKPLHFHFDLSDVESAYTLVLENGQGFLVDGLDGQPFAVLQLKNKTLEELVNEGFDPIDRFANWHMDGVSDISKVEEIEDTLYFETQTDSGYDIQFHIQVDDGIIWLKEGNPESESIRILLAKSYMKKLLSGQANLTRAMLFGKIKVSNLMGLYKYIRILGLKK